MQLPQRIACRTAPEAMFVPPMEQKRATRICQGCPIRLPCLREALENRIEHGVWGGMTERERRALLHRHPTTWGRMITTSTTTGHR